MLFDTLNNVKILEQAGFSEDQSKAVVGIWSKVVKEQFVTKKDLTNALLAERLETNKKYEEVHKSISKLDQRILLLDQKVDQNSSSIKEVIKNTDSKIEKLEEKMVLLINNSEKRLTIRLGIIMVSIISGAKVLESFF